MKRIVVVLGPLVLIGTLLVSVPRYAAAFSQAEPLFFGRSTALVTGLGFGLLTELGIFYCIDSWFDAQRRGLKWHWLLLVGVGVQLVLGPAIIAPAIVGHLVNQEGELAGVLSWRPAMWGWAVVVAAAPALLLAAVAAASYLRVPVTVRRLTEARQVEEAKVPVEVVQLPVEEVKLPEWLTVMPDDLPHFRQLVAEGVIELPAGIRGQDLIGVIPAVTNERTGRNWVASVRRLTGSQAEDTGNGRVQNL